MKSKFILSVLWLFVSLASFASNVGTITHPIALQEKQITTEMAGVTSTGGGIGVQLRYTQRVAEQIKLEAGLGMNGGQYAGRGFFGADFQILEDYDYQPRLSVKTYYENAKEFGKRINKLGIAPTASKGFNFYGREIFPFLAMPMAVNLNSVDNSYKTSVNANLGATTKIMLEGIEGLMGSVEASVNIKDSFTAFFAGVTYTFN